MAKYFATFYFSPVLVTEGMRKMVIDLDSDANYSEVEVEDQLLEILTDDNTVRLIMIFTAKGCEDLAGMSGQEVLHQVIMKVLGMERKWPRDIQAISYLIETGKSVINNESVKRKRLHSVESVEDYISKPGSEHESVSAEAIATHPPSYMMLQSEQSSAIVTEWVDKIMALFSDDVEANCFMEKKLANIAKAQILVLCDFSDQVYRNIEKRVKYKVKNRFPNGLPWWEITL